MPYYHLTLLQLQGGSIMYNVVPLQVFVVHVPPLPCFILAYVKEAHTTSQSSLTKVIVGSFLGDYTASGLRNSMEFEVSVGSWMSSSMYPNRLLFRVIPTFSSTSSSSIQDNMLFPMVLCRATFTRPIILSN